MIESLRLQNFRSHRDFFVQLQPGPVIVTGNNGVGKTTILEAIYLALIGKSYRSNFRDIITIGQTWWRIDLTLTDAMRTIKFQNNQKEFIIGSKSTKTLSKKARRPVLLFEPNDLMIIYGSPSRRREFFDRFITQIEPDFAVKLAKFDRVLRQRNRLLKSDMATAENLLVWDVQLAELSVTISQKRRQIIQQINERLADNYVAIAGSTYEEMVKIKFVSEQYSSADILRRLQIDLRFGYLTTRLGAQRDDYEFHFATQNAKTNASRGENRTLLFAILASFAELINQRLHEKAYILLDDVDSELDQCHRENLYRVPIFTRNYLIATTIVFTGQISNNIKL
ncbi:MAG: DNA replication and repair protein RecF [Candidatus Nanoperiomorbaceae bacterium]